MKPLYLILEDALKIPIYIHGIVFDLKVDCILRKDEGEISIDSIYYGDVYIKLSYPPDGLFLLDQNALKTRHRLLNEDLRAAIQVRVLELGKNANSMNWFQKEDL